MRKLLSALCLIGVAGAAVGTQTAFEVASIRPSADQPQQANIGVHISASQVRITFLSLRDYVATAYGVRQPQVIGPDWLAQTRFDISAKLPDGASSDRVPDMLQALLVERFELKAHRAQQEFPVYALTATKDGPKVAAIADTSDAAASPGTVNVAASGSAAGLLLDLGDGASLHLVDNHLELRKVTTAQIARGLTSLMDRPVVDATSLSGRYTVTIELAPEDYGATLIRSAINAGVVLPPQALRQLDFGQRDPFSPVLQKYGLTLDSRKSNLDVVVVDSMRKTPLEN